MFAFWAERAVATTEPPPLRSLLHQVRNGMRVIEDRSRCQLALPNSPHLRVETILRLPGSLFPSCRLRQSPGMPRLWQFPPAGPYASSERFASSERRPDLPPPSAFLPSGVWALQLDPGSPH